MLRPVEYGLEYNSALVQCRLKCGLIQNIQTVGNQKLTKNFKKNSLLEESHERRKEKRRGDSQV